MKPTFAARIVFDITQQVKGEMSRQVKDVVAKAAFDIQAEAQNVVPVDTGALKNSISTEVAANDMSAIVAPHMNYDIYVEFGTSKMSARPYLFPAAEKVKPEFMAAMVKVAG